VIAGGIGQLISSRPAVLLAVRQRSSNGRVKRGRGHVSPRASAGERASFLVVTKHSSRKRRAKTPESYSQLFTVELPCHTLCEIRPSAVMSIKPRFSHKLPRSNSPKLAFPSACRRSASISATLIERASSISNAMTIGVPELAWIYRETERFLRVHATRLRENIGVKEASEFARWLEFSGLLKLFDKNPQPEPHKVDGPTLRKMVQEVIMDCGERFGKSLPDGCLGVSEVEKLNHKLDVIAGGIGQLISSRPAVLLAVRQRSSNGRVKRGRGHVSPRASAGERASFLVVTTCSHRKDGGREVKRNGANKQKGGLSRG